MRADVRKEGDLVYSNDFLELVYGLQLILLLRERASECSPLNRNPQDMTELKV